MLSTLGCRYRCWQHEQHEQHEQLEEGNIPLVIHCQGFLFCERASICRVCALDESVLPLSCGKPVHLLLQHDASSPSFRLITRNTVSFSFFPVLPRLLEARDLILGGHKRLDFGDVNRRGRETEAGNRNARGGRAPDQDQHVSRCARV